MDKMIENLIKDCISCQATRKQNPPAKLNIMPVPERIWQEINIEYLGPIPNGKYILVIMDQRSCYPEVEFVSSTSADQLLLSLDRIFSSYGLPEVIIMDNGPPFKAQAVKDYMLSHAIKHRRITPLWPQANAEAERFMQSLNKTLQAAYIEKVEWRRAVYEFLSQYRHTPHCTTKISPSEMMFNRRVRHTIPDQLHHSRENINETLERNNEKSKQKAKRYMDKRSHAKESSINVGDTAIIKQPKHNKLTSKFKVFPYKVTQIKGTMVTAENSKGHTTTRNVSHFERISDKEKFPKEREEHYINENKNPLDPPEGLLQRQQPHPRKLYPRRNRKPPCEWRKY